MDSQKINWTPIVNQLLAWQQDNDQRHWTIRWDKKREMWQVRVKEYCTQESFKGYSKYSQQHFTQEFLEDDGLGMAQVKLRFLARMFEELESYGDTPSEDAMRNPPDIPFEPRKDS